MHMHTHANSHALMQYCDSAVFHIAECQSKCRLFTSMLIAESCRPLHVGPIIQYGSKKFLLDISPRSIQFPQTSVNFTRIVDDVKSVIILCVAPSSRVPRHYSSTGISSTTLRLQIFRPQTFRLLLYTSVQDSYTSNFCFSKSLFSSIPTSTYTAIPFYQFHFH